VPHPPNYELRANNPIAVVRGRLCDSEGALTTRRISRTADGFDVRTDRDYYDRDGSRVDYDITHETFADLPDALKAAGVAPGSIDETAARLMALIEASALEVAA
jgi:hypothetical protein